MERGQVLQGLTANRSWNLERMAAFRNSLFPTRIAERVSRQACPNIPSLDPTEIPKGPQITGGPAKFENWIQVLDALIERARASRVAFYTHYGV